MKNKGKWLRDFIEEFLGRVFRIGWHGHRYGIVEAAFEAKVVADTCESIRDERAEKEVQTLIYERALKPWKEKHRG